MLILALDTTSRAGSCALARDRTVIREESGDPARSQAARLPGDLQRLLEHAGTPLDAIDVFAVASGPGSFTGLRVGIATMQGLAFAQGKPLIGVSALDALASLAGMGGERVAAWIDAWRGEVYAALYEDGREVEPAVIARPDALLRDIGATNRDVVVIGDGAATYAGLIQARSDSRIRVADPPAPSIAGAVAQLAADAARVGALPPPHAIRPLYVRRPDAELARQRGASAP